MHPEQKALESMQNRGVWSGTVDGFGAVLDVPNSYRDRMDVRRRNRRAPRDGDNHRSPSPVTSWFHTAGYAAAAVPAGFVH